MRGICGVARGDPQMCMSRCTIERMMAKLQHRGLDGSGVHVAPGIGLGIRRLSIIDLETGDQPIANEDGSIIVV
jgi:asparagine synthase (glutamine-hydrolysing)